MLKIEGKYCKDCKIFIDDVEESAMSTVYNILNNQAFENSKVRIMPDCLTYDSEILTIVGFKKISELSFDDMIANFNPINCKISFHKPIDIINRPLRLNEKIFLFNNKRGYAFSVSENHRMALKQQMGEIANNIESFFMKDYYFNGDGLTEVLNKYTDNEIRLICWIVGDGSINVIHNTRSDCYRIKFGLKKERKIKRLVSLLDEENMTYYFKKTDKQTSIIINKYSSEKYIEYVSKAKKLPSDFMFLSKRQSDVFFDEMIQIDGDYEAYVRYGTYRISSTDLDTINLISAIASINYGLSSIKKKGTRAKMLYYINLLKKNKLEYSRGGLHHSNFIKEEVSNYDKNVVCVTCDTGFFIARQKGMTFISGNCHQGKGIVIGFTSPLGKLVNPSHVGVDIGCAVSLYITDKEINQDEFKLIEHRVKKEIPFGTNYYSERQFETKDFLKYLRNFYNSQMSCSSDMLNQITIDEEYISSMLKRLKMDEGVFYKSIGTVGGGNHYIEFNNYHGRYAFSVHCGSRNFGAKVGAYWISKANNPKNDEKQLKGKIRELVKNAENKQDIPNLIAKLKEEELKKEHIGYLEGDELKDYLTDMVIASAYARYNHKVISNKIINILYDINKACIMDEIHSVHNYIDFEDKMIRKGAIRAHKNEKILIPLNMRDGIIIAKGLGNEDWNCSCSHGAGRKLSRKAAKENLSMEEFESSMKDIYTTTVCKNTIDESPMAYKDSNIIIEAIKPTCEILDIVKPIINIKSTESENNFK